MKKLKVEIGAAIEPVGDVSVRLDGNRCRSRAEFLREIGVALRFPSYYGENWDALEECIYDLEWLPDAQINLIVENADQLLASEPERQLEIFVDILRVDTGWERALTIRLDRVSEGGALTAFAPLVKR